MPTYVYRCPDCDLAFEVFQPKITDRPKSKKCPACGGRARREISGGAGFLFKGEGFYVTDYRSEEYRDQAAAEKGEAKPEKAEPKPDKPPAGKKKGRKDSAGR